MPLVALAVGMTAGSALAQQPVQTPNTIAPNTVAPNTIAPNTTGCTPQEKSAANTSEKLGQSNGVICPPDVVDPGGVKKPPAAGNTPVIPPPK
jgi:hypothetical protein